MGGYQFVFCQASGISETVYIVGFVEVSLCVFISEGKNAAGNGTLDGHINAEVQGPISLKMNHAVWHLLPEEVCQSRLQVLQGHPLTVEPDLAVLVHLKLVQLILFYYYFSILPGRREHPACRILAAQLLASVTDFQPTSFV